MCRAWGHGEYVFRCIGDGIFWCFVLSVVAPMVCNYSCPHDLTGDKSFSPIPVPVSVLQ